jgi:hypothetical protein
MRTADVNVTSEWISSLANNNWMQNVEQNKPTPCVPQNARIM